jgi:hypothetical protein
VSWAPVGTEGKPRWHHRGNGSRFACVSACNGTNRQAFNSVHTIEAAQGIPSGPHSERKAAGLAVSAEHANASVDQVRIQGSQAVATSHLNGEVTKSFAISTDFATSRSVQEHSAAWLEARSPHYLQGPVAE